MDTESLALLLDNAHRWFAAHQPLEDRLARFREGHVEAAGAWAQMADMGWLALPLPEAQEGFGASAAQCFALLRAAGRDARPEPLHLHLMLAPWWTRHRPQDAAELAGGRTRLALAELPAAPGGARWADGRLHGSAAVVMGGLHATHVLLPLADAAQGCAGSLLCVALNSPGVQAQPVRLLDGRHTLRLQFEGVHAEALSAESLHAEPLRAPAAQQALDLAAAGLVADAVGVLEAAFDLTLAYLKQRTQFGRPLSGQQALQHRMAEVFCDLQQLIALAGRLAAELAQQPDAPAPTLPVAKSFVGRRALRAMGQLIQVSGGIGMTEEYRLGHLYKRLQLDATLFGDAEHQLRRIDVRRSLCAA
ncbi:acyl-CoA dehydrogenase family protein [Aquincola tertiaricarbonis]|uniref:acyl-CoA dehydrogenase family protein n=1 Tax=Aquincola tertiaricarbonis TaxID=391953 RepID=UPI000698128D|nr:acyl-CoA dehydrogenase family protein [Aquincola tertiaricarbonis]